MKERCRDGCRTSLLIAGVFLVPAIFHTLLPPCHPYITIHFMEMIFSTCIVSTTRGLEHTQKNTHIAEVDKKCFILFVVYYNIFVRIVSSFCCFPLFHSLSLPSPSLPPCLNLSLTYRGMYQVSSRAPQERDLARECQACPPVSPAEVSHTHTHHTCVQTCCEYEMKSACEAHYCNASHSVWAREKTNNYARMRI